VTASENVRFVAALARAVDLLRRSPEPGAQQKAALRALVTLAGERSATLRFYAGELTLDGVAIPTADPRLEAFTERLAVHEVAEVVIAQGAGPDELLALAFGLAADPGYGRIKERLRDAGSARVMVILQQYRTHAPDAGSITGAFERQKHDQAVLAEWNAFLEQGERTEAERMAGATPPEGVEPVPAGGMGSGAVPPSRAHPASLSPIPPGRVRPASLSPIPPTPPPDAPVSMPSRPPRPSTLDVGSTPDTWFAAFERGVKKRFPDHFGDVDWGFVVDRGAATVTVGDPRTGASFALPLPQDYLGRSAWLLAGDLLAKLRVMAEKSGSLRRRR
jgi:hypothetical protein